jgi:hypothetical protein
MQNIESYESFEALNNYDSFEGFGFNVKTLKNEKGVELPSDFIAKKIISDPAIMGQMAIYVKLFGRKPQKDPILLSAQVSDIDQKLRENYRKRTRQNFVGTEENFEHFTKQPAYKIDESMYVDEIEKQKGVANNHFDEGFEGFLPLFAPDALRLGKKLGGKLIKKIGRKSKKKAVEATQQTATANNLMAKSQLNASQAEAIRAGVSPEMVQKIVGDQAKKDREIAKRNLEILDTVVTTVAPKKTLDKLKDMFQEFKDKETQKEITKNVPVIIGVMALVAVLAFILGRRN